MTLREFRHRWTPKWLRTDARRSWRNVMFRRIGIQRCYTPPVLTRRPDMLARSWLPYVVAHEVLRNPELTFLQIGAYDGEGDDDLGALIRAYRLRGVLVEPQAGAFTRLAHTYRDQPQVTLLQAAIAERQGMRDFYVRRGAVSMAASFHRDHLLRHGIPASEVVAERVECHTVASALAAGGLKRADLIQIDAEGFDWPIIRSIEFARMRPAIVRFEYRNMSERDADACLEFLAAHGYKFLLEARDILAHRIADADREFSLDAPARRSA
jgi:FkbM family methyltransferase